jgi:hypothetical protein
MLTRLSISVSIAPTIWSRGIEWVVAAMNAPWARA